MAAHVLIGAKINSPILRQPLGKLFQEAFVSYKKNTKAVIDLKSGEFYTYEQLLELSKNLASNLRDLGIEKNDIIAIVSENSHKFCVALLAGLYLAAPVHLINPGYTEYEIKYSVSLSQAKLVFCSKKSLNNLIAAKEDLDFLKTIVLFDDDEAIEGIAFYKNLIKENAMFTMEENIDCGDQTAIICNSSGTTGLPKGVMITHEFLALHLAYSKDPEIDHVTSYEVWPMVVPFFHIYGFGSLIVSFYSGSTMVAIDHFNPEPFLQTIQDYKVERLYLVPSLIGFLKDSPLIGHYDLSSLKHIFTAAAPILDESSKLLQRKLNLKTIRQIYGLTEVGIIVETPRDGLSPTGSCGKVTPGHQLKIADMETRRKLAANQTGEICVKNYTMKGYINDIQKTNESIDSEGFLRTGDIGYYDEEGFVYVIGRSKDIIKYKGFQVSPTELENILSAHGSIKDVAVVGRPDSRFGEVSVGFVVKEKETNLTESEVCDYLARFVCVEKRLHGGVRFVEELPRNAAGKILRTQLRQSLINNL